MLSYMFYGVSIVQICESALLGAHLWSYRLLVFYHVHYPKDTIQLKVLGMRPHMSPAFTDALIMFGLVCVRSGNSHNNHHWHPRLVYVWQRLR